MLTNEEIVDFQSILNKIMDDFNAIVCQNDKASYPIIQGVSPSKYQLYTPNDNGSGTSNKILIVSDMECLSNTELPYVIHDSVMFSEISYDRLSEIINIYTQSPKQIFIAIDGIIKYSN